jgi:hypothetical protein
VRHGLEQAVGNKPVLLPPAQKDKAKP